MTTRITAFFAAIFFFFFSQPVGFGESCHTKAEAAIESQSAYILSLTQPDGSLPMTLPAIDRSLSLPAAPECEGISPDEYLKWKTAKICPYFSCIALSGLLIATPEKAREAAENYISWHFAHLNTAETDYSGVGGTIYDYRIFVSDDKRCICLPIAELKADVTLAYDSTDSYAAVFLKLLCDYSLAYPDSDFLLGREAETEMVISSIESTFVEKLGLTYAKPTYNICYLMDNCEVFDGLSAASILFEKAFGNVKRARELADFADKIKCGIETKMLSLFTGSYYASVAADGKHSSSVTSKAMSSFYPDGAAQLFPIICGIVEPDSFHARQLYTMFNVYFGTGKKGESWQTLDVGSSFPWALLLRASVLMGDGERTEQYLDTVKEKFFDSGCKYPYYCAEAGQLVTALAAIE